MTSKELLNLVERCVEFHKDVTGLPVKRHNVKSFVEKEDTVVIRIMFWESSNSTIDFRFLLENGDIKEMVIV